MSGTVFQIVDSFYDAVWELAEDLMLIERQAGQTAGEIAASGKKLIDPLSLVVKFNEKAMPFLALEGSDLPQALHLPFMEIEETLKETLYPGMDVIREEWLNLFPNETSGKIEQKSPNEPTSRILVKKGCASMSNILEMGVIPHASEMAKDLKPA